MLKEINDHIVFSESHLFEPEIKTMDGIYERYSQLDINVLVHIVSDPSCRYERNFGKGRISSEFSEMKARDRIISILTAKSITANPKGYYVNKHKNTVTALSNEQIKSVSFSFCNIRDIPKHFSARGSKYGIIFFHDFLASRGMRKVRYINDHDPLQLRTLLFNSPYLIESYGKGYDMRWESEWRIQGGLNFCDDDVAIIIVPDYDYDDFLEELYNKDIGSYFVFPSSLFDDQINYFLKAHTYEYSYWSQIELFGGMKIDFDTFPFPNQDELDQIKDECGEWIEILCKAAVQEVYETRFVQKYKSFMDKIDINNLDKKFVHDMENVARNADEPRQTHRDIMMHCYERRFDIQRERMNF